MSVKASYFYESPEVELIEVVSPAVLCGSNTEDYNDGGEVDWFITE